MVNTSVDRIVGDNGDAPAGVRFGRFPEPGQCLVR
jgi:hypothetical protein